MVRRSVSVICAAIATLTIFTYSPQRAHHTFSPRTSGCFDSPIVVGLSYLRQPLEGALPKTISMSLPAPDGRIGPSYGLGAIAHFSLCSMSLKAAWCEIKKQIYFSGGQMSSNLAYK